MSKSNYKFRLQIERSKHDLREEVLHVLRSYEPISIEEHGDTIFAEYPIPAGPKFVNGPQAWNTVDGLRNRSVETYESVFLFEPSIYEARNSILGKQNP
jgi:hypothetical protein